MPRKKASPSRSDRGTNPPGGGWGKGGRKGKPAKKEYKAMTGRARFRGSGRHRARNFGPGR